MTPKRNNVYLIKRLSVTQLYWRYNFSAVFNDMSESVSAISKNAILLTWLSAKMNCRTRDVCEIWVRKTKTFDSSKINRLIESESFDENDGFKKFWSSPESDLYSILSIADSKSRIKSFSDVHFGPFALRKNNNSKRNIRQISFIDYSEKVAYEEHSPS